VPTWYYAELEDGRELRVGVDEDEPYIAVLQVREPGDHSTWQHVAELATVRDYVQPIVDIRSPLL